MKNALLFILVFGFANAHAEDLFFDGRTGETAEFAEQMRVIPKGSIVVVSEAHNFLPHQRNQLRVVAKLHELGHQVDTAFEFIQRRFGSELLAYQRGLVSDEDFLKQIEWRDNFSNYKPILWAPTAWQGQAWGINADLRISGKVSKAGFDSLTENERAEIPEGFALGDREYLERFTEAMKNHVGPTEIPNYFAAQCIRDDTMAFELKRRQNEHPERTIVVIVGDFHNSYGGGLPDRLRERGTQNIYTVSQIVWTKDQDEIDMLKDVRPHPQWGIRADWVWVAKWAN